MEDREHRHPFVGERTREVEHLHPVVQVEVARRLVQQQHPRLLGERLGEREPLQVAPGELVGGLLGETQRVGERHGALHYRAVTRAWRREARDVRVAAHRDEVAGGDRERRAHLLRQTPHKPRALERGQRPGVSARRA